MLLMRHASTAWNSAGRKFGRTDIPLEESGRTAAWQLDVDSLDVTCRAVYTSPLTRAHETAAILAHRLGLFVVPAAALIERDHGSAEGMTTAERASIYPDGRISGRESDEAVRARAGAFVAHLPRRALVVTHAGVIFALTGRKVDHLETVEWNI